MKTMATNMNRARAHSIRGTVCGVPGLVILVFLLTTTLEAQTVAGLDSSATAEGSAMPGATTASNPGSIDSSEFTSTETPALIFDQSPWDPRLIEGQAPQADDSLKFNKYGDLLNDNPLYVTKSSPWMVVGRLTLANVTTWAIDRYVLNADFARIGFNSWKHNIQTGWEWDTDRFGMNYFFHPFSGGMFFNAARANGYTYFESVPFAFLGSLEWEYFFENTLPSYNDFINTPINGSFLGEIFYRLGSNILDDQTTGWDRFAREAAVAIMTPTRFFSRLMNGSLTRLTTEEVYQKEPLNVTLTAGYHQVNEGTRIEKGTQAVSLGMDLDYGNPLEKRERKPFDYFQVQTALNFGDGRKIITKVTGDAVLYGRNIRVGDADALLGIFQRMNFFDNNTFEFGAIAFGPGLIGKLPTSQRASLYADFHVGIVPLAGLSGRYGPDTTQMRDYNFGGGAEAKMESAYDFGFLKLSMVGYVWWFHTYVGLPGNSYVALVKPRIVVPLFSILSIGFEHIIYYSERYPRDFAPVHSVRTEQKLFFQLFFEEFKFKKR
ncbi:MAG: DUF3943 domain-containing protein [Ignavibacteria bacterium]|nr:DUF3943 domain-containing protein [Ignavibacteria bacterium]